MPLHPPLINSHDEAAHKHALAHLKQGRLIGLPTETVYGLAADAANEKAVQYIYAVKGRPWVNPLIIHISGVEMAARYGRFDERAKVLAKAFWPGSLTLVVPKITPSPLSGLATAGLESVALRCPAASFTRELIAALDRPLAAPSANPSGKISPTCAVHVREAFSAQDVPLVIDGGPCRVGLESTILLCVPGKPLTILRHGSIFPEALAHTLGEEPGVIVSSAPDTDASPLAPGMLSSHYAPEAETILAIDPSIKIGSQDAVLTFAGQRLKGDEEALIKLDLSPCGNLQEAAMNLFAMLHMIDSKQPRRILVLPVPQKGLGIAIMDRLKRAAANKKAAS